LLVILGLSSGPFTAGLAKAQAQMRGFAAETQSSSAAASTSMAGAGLAATALGLAIAGVGVLSVRSAINFQSSMELIRTQAGATQAEVDAMKASVMALATTLPQSPEQLAAGLYHVESAGLRGAQAMELLTIAAKGATVGQADLESVTNALIAVNQTAIGGVNNFSEAMGTLNAIVGTGNMRMQDLTDAFSSGILSAAKTFGITIQSVGGALATLTDMGMPATDAATRLRMSLALIGAPTAKASEELAKIGLSSTQLANDMRGPGGILAAMVDLKTHLESAGLSATQQAAVLSSAFGGGRSSVAILSLIGNLDLLRAKTDAVGKGAGDFEDAWAAAQQTTAVRLGELASNLQVIAIRVGTVLLPVVNTLVGALGAVASHAEIVVPVFLALAAAVTAAATAMTVRLVAGLVMSTAQFLAATAANVLLGSSLVATTASTLGLSGALVTTGTSLATFGGAAKGLAIGPLGLLAAAIGAIVVAYSLLSAALDKQTQELTAKTTKWATDVSTTVEQLKQAREGIAAQLAALSTGLNKQQNIHRLQLQVSTGMTDVFGAKDKIQAQLDVIDAELKKRSEDAGRATAQGYAAGVTDGEGDVVTSGQGLVDHFGSTLAGVREAAAQEGAQAMLDMAAALQKNRDAPLQALLDLHTAEKTAMTTHNEIVRLQAELQQANLVEGLKSGDPIVKAQSEATVKLITDQLDRLTGGAYSAAQNAALNIGSGLGSSKAIANIATNLNRLLGPVAKVFDQFTGTSAFSLMLSTVTKGLNDQAVKVNNWAPLAGSVDEVNTEIEKLNAQIAALDKNSEAANAALSTMAADAKAKLTSAFDAVKTSAHTFFDDLHAKNTKAISDTKALADAALDAQERAISGQVNAAQAALDATRAAAQEAQLRANLATAQGPDAQMAAQAALNDFLAQSRIDTMRKAADAQIATLEDQKKANDAQAAEQQKAEDKRYHDQVAAFDRELAALKGALTRHPQQWRSAQDQIMTLLAKYGIQYEKAGKDSADSFIKGLKAKVADVTKAAQAVAAAAAAALGGTPTPTPAPGGGATPVPGSAPSGGPHRKLQSGTLDTGPNAIIAELHPHEAVLPPDAAAALRAGNLAAITPYDTSKMIEEPPGGAFVPGFPTGPSTTPPPSGSIPAPTGGTPLVYAPSAGGTSAGAPGSMWPAGLVEALTAFVRALQQAVSRGIPIELDGQTIGDIFDRAQYASANRYSSGFVTQPIATR
jgi:TP901 family phage tail tape measure protein